MTRPILILAAAGMIATSARSLPASVTSTMRTEESANRGYVLGRFAFSDDRLADAARYFDEARRQEPGDVALMRQTFEVALAAGNEKLAEDLAKQLAAANASDSTVALVRVAEALKRRDWAAAEAARPGLADAGYAAVVGPIVEAWTLFGRGKTDEALAIIDPAKFTGFGRSYVTEHRALMLSAAKRWDAATPLYTELLNGEARSVTRLRIAAAAALQAGGHKAEATALLAEGGADPTLADARQRIAADKRIESTIIEPRQGMAWLVARLAGDLSRENPVPLALVFARVATFLAPESSDVWVIAGDVLARGGRGDAALVAYAHVGDKDPLAWVVRTRQASVLSDQGKDADARRLLEAATASPTATSDDWVRLGDLDRKLSQYAAAASAYDRAIAVAGTAAPWPLYFLRGSAYEQGGDWVRAEPDLRVALKLAPQEPAVLNYLGYALLDRGLKLAEAQSLIETASRLRPDDGFITDSLGWAYFRTNQFAKAVPVLERAAAAEPGDPTLNEHVGDAYWRVGRRIEARFRWRAALDLDPTPAQKVELAAKLNYGLDVAMAQAASPKPSPATPQQP